MTDCKYCHLPEYPVLFNHPYFYVVETPEEILCVQRGHGKMSGCDGCVLRRMKKQFELIVHSKGLTGQIESNKEGEHRWFAVKKELK